MDKSSFRPVHLQPVSSQKLKQTFTGKSHGEFSFHLQQAIQTTSKLTISKHAKERLQQRDIHISESRWESIQQKVDEAKKMGIKDSLVLLNDAALIVSAKNNTVITAMDRKEATTQIFTNINGTIVLE